MNEHLLRAAVALDTVWIRNVQHTCRQAIEVPRWVSSTAYHLALVQDVHFAAVVIVPQQPVVRRQQQPVGAGTRPKRL